MKKIAGEKNIFSKVENKQPTTFDKLSADTITTVLTKQDFSNGFSCKKFSFF